jgi:hypothetical protein
MRTFRKNQTPPILHSTNTPAPLVEQVSTAYCLLGGTGFHTDPLRLESPRRWQYFHRLDTLKNDRFSTR